MIIEFGHYALVLALATGLVVSIIPLIGARRGDEAMMSVGRDRLAGAICACSDLLRRADLCLYGVGLLGAECLGELHSLMPAIYKFSGVWGQSRGIDAALAADPDLVFGAGRLVRQQSSEPPEGQCPGGAGLDFHGIPVVHPADVEPLHPHRTGAGGRSRPQSRAAGYRAGDPPPLLYLGYVGFSVCFSFAVAALIEGRIDAAWARWVRPWTLAAWTFLTAGIAMGSYWAYYELGWGGWWFWDPVENASFMPWLAGTALLHSAVVMEKREALKIWTVLLAILTFSLSLLGTFLVRSGVLTSVHAFATDPSRGIFILAILCLFIGGALALFALRRRR